MARQTHMFKAGETVRVSCGRNAHLDGQVFFEHLAQHLAGHVLTDGTTIHVSRGSDIYLSDQLIHVNAKRKAS